MVLMVACHCRNHDLLMTMVAVTAIPRWAQNWSSQLSRGPFCAVVRAEREYGNDNLPGARSGLVKD
eukprot:13401078-Alexandrium_andersonii.AAC.1